jgi:DNA-binding transcriptional MocR family regulator
MMTHLTSICAHNIRKVQAKIVKKRRKLKSNKTKRIQTKVSKSKVKLNYEKLAKSGVLRCANGGKSQPERKPRGEGMSLAGI